MNSGQYEPYERGQVRLHLSGSTVGPPAHHDVVAAAVADAARSTTCDCADKGSGGLGAPSEHPAAKDAAAAMVRGVELADTAVTAAAANKQPRKMILQTCAIFFSFFYAMV